MSKRARILVRSLTLASALLAFGSAGLAHGGTPTPAATPPPRPLPIDKNSALILIRTTLVALQQANQTGNYGVFYGISAPGFQNINSPDRLSQIFANLRGKNFDLSGVVVLEPQLNVLPEVYANGVMRMAGFFPSVPLQVYFDLQFIPVQGQWRLLSIAVDVGTSTPTAPVTSSGSPGAAGDLRGSSPAARVTPTESVPRVSVSPRSSSSPSKP